MGESRMSITLAAVLLGGLAAIIALAVIAWLYIGDLNDRTQANNDVEVVDAALGVSRYSNSLTATGTVESNVTMTRDSVIAARAAIASGKAELAGHLALLEDTGYDARVGRIKQQVDLLTDKIDQIDNSRPDLLRAILAGEQNRQNLVFASNRELIPALVSSHDNQFYFMLTGQSDNRPRVATGAEAFSREEFIRFNHLGILMNSVGIGHSSLMAASSMRDPTLLTNVEEGFRTSAQRGEKSIEFLAENGGYELDPDVVPLSRALFETGSGEGNYFDALKSRLAMAVEERERIAEARQLMAGLQGEVDALVDDVRRRSEMVRDESAQAASTGRMIVLIVGIIGAVVVVAGGGFLALGGRRD